MRSALGLVLAGVLLGSCGGGGEEAADLFVGRYHSMAFYGAVFDAQTDGFGPSWGIRDPDGRGLFDYVRHSPYTDTSEGRGRYALHDDHSMTCWYAEGEEHGGLERFGRVAVFNLAAALDTSLITILLSQVGGFGDDVLDGEYHWAGLGSEPLARGFALSGGRATFDGSGGWSTTPFHLTVDGFVGAVTPSTGLTYAVDADARLTMDDAVRARDLTGSVLAGGELAVAVGGTESGQGGALYAFVPAGSGLSPDTLGSRYWVVGMRRTTDAWRSLFGQLVADGAGHCYFAGEAAYEGEIVAADPFSAVYDVEDDGALTLTIEDGPTLLGGVHRQGTYFVLGGGTVPDDAAWFLLGVAP